MRNEFKRLIETQIQEIDQLGFVQVIESLDGKSVIKHDRTVSLKNLISSYKQLSEIYPETEETVNLKSIRENL